jgi:hypothetical protein
MTDPKERPREVDRELLPRADDSGASAGEADQIASQQFVHGLLVFLHEDDESKQDERIDRLMDSIDGARTPVIATLRRPMWRAASALAACLLIVLTLAWLGLPSGQSAYAIVQQSIEASQLAGDRRYEVSAMHRNGDADSGEPIAVLDIRDEQHVLLRADTREGHRLVVGRNADGKWALRPDGTVERLRPERAWPNWINLGDSTVLVESVDQLLQRLDGHYRLTRGEAETLGDDPQRLLQRVTAELLERDSPDPQRIDFWIDAETHIVQRMELRWSEQQRRRAGPGQQDGPPQRAARPRPDDPPHRGEARRPGGPPPSPSRERRGGEGSPPHGDRRAPDAPPPGEWFGQEGGPPRGGHSDPNRPPPRFIEGPPRFGEGAHPPPPEVIVFARVDAPEFPNDWFDPERHAE